MKLPDRCDCSKSRPGTCGRWLVLACATLLLAGCGTDFTQVAGQAGTATAHTVLDLWLTDLANAVLDQHQPPPDGDREDAADDGDDDDADADDGAGAASPGEAAFVAQGCGVCHGDNAEGASSPALAGMDELAALEQRFAGGGIHMGAALTDQEIADVADWLLGDDAADGGGDQLVMGEDAYVAGNCGACHGAGAEGGSGPALAGMDSLAALEERFAGGANHLGSTLADQDIEDVAAWLASL